MASKTKNTTKGFTSNDTRNERRHRLAGNMNFAASEAYKLLRTNLMFSFSDNSKCRIIGMTSSFRGEGKSLTSINLAYTLAESNKKVLLIEGDMRLPTFSGRLRLNATPGLSNVLAGINTTDEAIQPFVIDADADDALQVDVMVSGDIPPNPSELLGSEHAAGLLNLLRGKYDYIIFDLPPVTAVTDALVVSKLVDGIVVVVRNNHAVRGALAETIRQLKLVDAHILGFVFNGATESGSSYYKGKSYYKGNYYKK